ncbi:methyl-accepting chemotaxis protein [Metabacillus sp. B2-18]|uniref:methyl-accepting chemotaxis protein n=1 Tax=Metabacillus sp. B2-18 TaxID=2897333 RepID=UPI001E3647B7|nr:methyl-accepting chemotaxis protein [Metabacillus sp. B2-18]UGB32461.1 methyl-accepting chemotaxis protein [Metabacillus sp. B2-18]
MKIRHVLKNNVLKGIDRNLTIRKKLIIAFACILLVPSLAIGFISYQSAKSELQDSMLQTAKESVQLIDSSMNSQLIPIEKDIEYFAQTAKTANAKIDIEEISKIKLKFNQYIETKPGAQAIYIGTDTGEMIVSPTLQLPDDYDPRDRPWYTLAMENKGEVVITDPYIDANTNETSVTFAKVLNDGSGVVAVDVNLNVLKDMISVVKVGEEGYVTIVDETQTYLIHPSKQGEKVTGDWVGNLFKSNTGEFSYTIDGKAKEMDFITNELTGWKIAGTMYTSEISEAAKGIFLKTLAVVLSSILGAIVIFVIIRSILQPIRILVASSEKIANGDLAVDININSNDEVGQLSKSFNKMVENLRAVVVSLQTASERVSSSSEELIASADQSTAGTKQVTEAIQQVASGAESQTFKIDANNAALDEVLQGILRISSSSSNVSDIAQETVSEAEVGGKFVKDSLEQMKFIHASVTESNKVIQSLSKRSQEIGKILDAISEIANQTNLLALNAAIEAARAGEHGKGFAVVADEVRKLAEQSQQSAGQISTLILSIQKDTNHSVQVMGEVSKNAEQGLTISTETSEKFDSILNRMNTMTPQIEEVSATVQQITAAIQEVTASANELAIIAKESSATSEEVAATTEQQLASMEEITAASKALTGMAEELQSIIDRFKV